METTKPTDAELRAKLNHVLEHADFAGRLLVAITLDQQLTIAALRAREAARNREKH